MFVGLCVSFMMGGSTVYLVDVFCIYFCWPSWWSA